MNWIRCKYNVVEKHQYNMVEKHQFSYVNYVSRQLSQGPIKNGSFFFKF